MNGRSLLITVSPESVSDDWSSGQHDEVVGDTDGKMSEDVGVLDVGEACRMEVSQSSGVWITSFSKQLDEGKLQGGAS